MWFQYEKECGDNTAILEFQGFLFMSFIISSRASRIQISICYMQPFHFNAEKDISEPQRLKTFVIVVRT